MAEGSVVYLVAWIDSLSGFDTHEAIRGAFLTKAEAEAEVERVAEAIKRRRADRGGGVFDRGLTILEVPLGQRVTVDKGLYLAPYVNKSDA